MLKVLTMRRLGKTRKIMKKIRSCAILAKMVKLARGWAQSPAGCSARWRHFRKSR